MVMQKVNIFEVKAKLSEYLDRALRGERIVICRHNKPVAELRPVEGVRTEPRPIGTLPGRPAFDIPEAFFEPLPDAELDRWEGLGDASLVTRGTPGARGGASKVAERGRTYRTPARRRGSKRS